MMFGTWKVLQAGGGPSYIHAVWVLYNPGGPSTTISSTFSEGGWQNGEKIALGRPK